MSTREPEEWSVEGLVEHVWRIERRMLNRRFCFILGAGASVQSGIPAAGALVRRWLGELHQRHARGRALEQWATADALEIGGFELANATSFYSQVFARRFRQHPEEGYADLEDIMQGKEPSFGYSVLAHILANTRHKLVITTNFDNLVADALSIFTATSPLVCGHESLAPFISVAPRRPVVVKIHRDLLMAPMNRAEEIGALQSPWREPLTRVFSTYTPIVVGYGGNDGSLMGFLKDLGPGAIPGGMFWCFWGPGGLPGPEVRELVAQHNGALVPIDGFDELMVLLSAKLEIPFLDRVLEEKSRARLENYRRSKESLLARIYPPPPPREDIAAPEPVLEASHPEAADEDEDAEPSADDELPARLEASPAPPASASTEEPAPPAISPAAAPPPAVRRPSLERVLSDSPGSAAPPPPPRGEVRSLAPSPAAEATRSGAARPPSGPDLPTLSSRASSPPTAVKRSAEPPAAPAPKATSAATADDTTRLDEPLRKSTRGSSAGEVPQSALQGALQRLALDADDTAFAALMQARGAPDYARSFELFRAALRRFPDDPGLRLAFAERLSEVPDPSSVREAISVLDDHLQRDPLDARALRHLALLKAWRADFKGATAELRRAWSLAASPLQAYDLALAAFIAGMFARRGSRNDTRFLAILKATIHLYGPPELVLPRTLVAGLIKNLDNPSRRLYGALDKMLAEGLPLARVEVAEPRFGEIAPADLTTLGPDDAP